jgi:hypothetical protein
VGLHCTVVVKAPRGSHTHGLEPRRLVSIHPLCNELTKHVAGIAERSLNRKPFQMRYWQTRNWMNPRKLTMIFQFYFDCFDRCVGKILKNVLSRRRPNDVSALMEDFF